MQTSTGIRKFIHWCGRKRNPKRRLEIRFFLSHMLKKQFYRNLGYPLNLKHPRTLNEKLQWFKVHVRDPKITLCADKYAVRTYVEGKVGKEHLVPLLGVYDSVEDIDIDSLPDQFVLKPNHESARVIICTDKSKMNWKKTADILNDWLHENYYYEWGEWGYKNIPPKILCEKLLADDIIDYRIFCFSGRPFFVKVTKSAGHSNKNGFFDVDFNCIFIPEKNNEVFTKPKEWDKMLRLAEALSAEFPFVRVDLYGIGDKVYFSELTFTPANGMDSNIPKEWDLAMGDLYDLSKYDRKFIV